jgi:integrase
VRNLSYSLKTMTAHMGGGAYTTRADRKRGFFLIARELEAAGYRFEHARNLKPKHVNAMVANWQAAELKPGTIKNRLSWMRRWAAECGKAGMIPASNAALGIENRTQFKGNRAKFLSPAELATVEDERVRLALRLQQAFGLRREEALKFRVAMADKHHGGRIELLPAWCKGGRGRTIPLSHPGQRALLEEVHRVCGKGSLIPDEWSYRQAVKHYDNTTHRAGLKNLHGLRHWHAQFRYRRLTGLDAPAAGGPTEDRMTADQVRVTRAARMEISRELGHGRMDVTDTYLGRRFSGGKGAA